MDRPVKLKMKTPSDLEVHVLVSEIELAWIEEVERRVAAFDRGEMPTYFADEVFAEVSPEVAVNAGTQENTS